MYSNKVEGPRRGRSFDSINIGFEEKLLNNEVGYLLVKKKPAVRMFPPDFKVWSS